MDENEDPKTRMEKRQAKERKWMDAQIVGLTAWVNSFLARRNQKIENLETDFRDGVRLADFLELACLFLFFFFCYFAFFLPFFFSFVIFFYFIFLFFLFFFFFSPLYSLAFLLFILFFKLFSFFPFF